MCTFFYRVLFFYKFDIGFFYNYNSLIQSENCEYFLPLTIFSLVSGLLMAIYRMTMDPSIQKEFKKIKFLKSMFKSENKVIKS